jgi:hypothetical protein
MLVTWKRQKTNNTNIIYSNSHALRIRTLDVQNGTKYRPRDEVPKHPIIRRYPATNLQNYWKLR